MEIEVIVEIKECPICHGTETISQRAAKKLKEEGKLAKEVFTSLSQLRIPMVNPVGLTVPMLMVYQDACAKCGFARTTKAETFNAPVNVRMTGQQPPPGFDIRRG